MLTEILARTLRPGDHTGDTPGHWIVVEPATVPYKDMVKVVVKIVGDGALEARWFRHDQRVWVIPAFTPPLRLRTVSC